MRLRDLLSMLVKWLVVDVIVTNQIAGCTYLISKNAKVWSQCKAQSCLWQCVSLLDSNAICCHDYYWDQYKSSLKIQLNPHTLCAGHTCIHSWRDNTITIQEYNICQEYYLHLHRLNLLAKLYQEQGMSCNRTPKLVISFMDILLQSEKCQHWLKQFCVVT